MSEVIGSGALSQELMSTLTQELRSDESLVWSGTPNLESLRKSHPIASNIFSFLLVYAAVGMIAGLIVAGVATHSFYKTSGLMVAGTAFVWAIIFLRNGIGNRKEMKRFVDETIYGLTTQRAIIIDASLDGKPRVVNSYQGEQLSQIVKRIHPDGGGDLIFEQEAVVETRSGQRATRPRGFRAIREVDQVEELVRRTLKLS